MNLREQRAKTNAAILEGKFIEKVLQENATSIDKAISEKTDSFNSAFWKDRNFQVNNTTLVYTSKLQHRFLDMKTRQSKNGLQRKKNYAIHNKPIFGHLSTIVRELNFGFTESIKSEILNLHNSSI